MKKRERKECVVVRRSIAAIFAVFSAVSCAQGEPSAKVMRASPSPNPRPAQRPNPCPNPCPTPDPTPSQTPSPNLAPNPTSITTAQALDLFYTSLGKAETPPACDASAEGPIYCLLDARYAGDERAHITAGALYRKTGSVAGVEREHVMDGGYRGRIHIVPVLPIDDERVHLERVANALYDYDGFFAELERRGNAHVSYRWRDLALRFFRSVKARTPSAYALGWTVAYNVDGSLNKTDASVRETLFHEIFHLNDAAHGTTKESWSDRTLADAYAAIVKKCGADTACLSKFAPNDTKVKGGTYYAFQPGNDVGEYAAELAVRYYKEQRGALGLGPLVKPAFKCTGAVNAKSWNAMVSEFFAGIDLVPSCP